MAWDYAGLIAKRESLRAEHDSLTAKIDASEFGTSTQYIAARAQVWKELQDIEVLIQKAGGNQSYVAYNQA